MFLCRTLRGLTGGKLIKPATGTPEASNQIGVLSLSVRQDLTAGATMISWPQQGTTLQHYHHITFASTEQQVEHQPLHLGLP